MEKRTSRSCCDISKRFIKTAAKKAAEYYTCRESEHQPEQEARQPPTDS